jgi:3D (Asp-Asp-Asp) domain-containing protein
LIKYLTIILLLSGICPNCIYITNAHVTAYAPAIGDELNCQEPCNITASGLEVEIGVTAACGPNIPFGTHVVVEGLGEYICYDRGGAIDDDEVDIAVDYDYVWTIGNGERGVIWILK